MNIKILKYIPERDRDKLINFLRKQPPEDLYRRFLSPKVDYEKYVDEIVSKNGIVYIAYKEKDVIGLCEAYQDEAGEWETAIIVDRRYRRRGVGRELLKHVAREVVKKGGKIIYGIIDRSNTSAINFGVSLGADIRYVDTRTVKVVFHLDRIKI